MNDRPERRLQLITRTRSTGHPSARDLLYADDGVVMFVAAGEAPGDGAASEWYRDVIADPRVEVHIGERHWRAVAATVTDPATRERGLALLDLEADDAGEVPLVTLEPQ